MKNNLRPALYKTIKKAPLIVTGIKKFEEIVAKKAFYGDKTLLVRDVLHSGSTDMFILRPPRWGKSLNLPMLKYFLEEPLREGTTKRGEIDFENVEEKKNFFKNKKVLLENPEMGEYLGKYTVLSLSVSGFEFRKEEGLYFRI